MLENIVGKACSSRFAGETDLCIRKIGLSRRSSELRDEWREEAARKDRLGNRLRHAENYTDAIIPNNSVAASRANYRESCLRDACCAIL